MRGSGYYLSSTPNASAPTQEQPSWNFSAVEDQPVVPQSAATASSDQPVTIKIPPMAPNTRRSTRQNAESIASGSEYNASTPSMDVDDQGPDDEDEKVPPPKQEFTKTRGGRRIIRKSYVESDNSDEGGSSDDELNVIGRKSDPAEQEAPQLDGTPDDEEAQVGGHRLRKRGKPKTNGIVESDDEGQAVVTRYALRNRGSSSNIPRTNGSRKHTNNRSSSRKSKKRTRKVALPKENEQDEDVYVDEPDSSSGSADASLDDAPGTTPEPERGAFDEDADAEGDADGDQGEGRPYALRQRAKINYAIPPPLEEMKPPSPKPRRFGRTNSRGNGRAKVPGWSATGAELSKWMGGGGGDDSDSDYATRTPRKGFGLGGSSGGLFAGSAGTGGLLPADLAAAAGTPSNLGKVGDASLADTDPLGVNQNVTFDEVGGLDDYIKSLQEMTLLPLLYPEVFQRLGVTPPRGVLFHGPPGTGKTLMARALAASCRANGKGISFFMRKGADCLSKWVGEAERQLRLLFEEARNSQPSIIFFDEIDGLAPVRSSKQDQIHASIVSTLLALMDGMDNRGQVIVIGATNRPDAVDPALRRPGRFDREFFFPLPNIDARERILRIMTRKWAGWEDEKGEQQAKGLAKLTKGYGGADLRALCTEAALNAIQRRYPQIYKSQERLLLNPESITVELRDFMISVKKLIPSSARATAPAASQLPEQLVPLLQDALDRIKAVVDKVLPVSKPRNALEEAEWEDEGDEGALAREMLLQSMETMRIYRPRVLLYGEIGMGQNYVASAALHHLEGFHVQSLDMGNLMSDSTRTAEAAIVQLFVEAKRHQPSVVYIPSLLAWCAAVSETARMTVRAMLDSLAPTDPVLLLAVVEGPFTALPKDVRAWFGSIKENRVQLLGTTTEQREKFFEGLLHDVARPPNHFPDGIKRKKRVLEVLPVAPPLEPRPPSAAELAVQEENDQRVITLLKYRLGPILTELKRKFKRFTKRAAEEYNLDAYPPAPPPSRVQTVSTSVEVRRTSPSGAVIEITNEETTEQTVEQPVDVEVNDVEGISEAAIQMQVQVQPQLFDMDLERMHLDLYKSKYLTPDDFLDDIRKIVHNANVHADQDPERLYRAQAMLTAAEVSIQDFDPQFRLECQRMASREGKRREEMRKAREAARAAEEKANEGQVYAPGTRRSARHNGQQPELSITDPLQLERRLKRARSHDTAAESEDQDMDGRNNKRSRVSSAEAEGAAPVDGQRPTPPSSKSHAVHFADEGAQTANEKSKSPPLDVNGIAEAVEAVTSNGLDADIAADANASTGAGESSQPPTREPSQPVGFGNLLNPMSPNEPAFDPAVSAPLPDARSAPSIDNVLAQLNTPVVQITADTSEDPAPQEALELDGLTREAKVEMMVMSPPPLPSQALSDVMQVDGLSQLQAQEENMPTAQSPDVPMEVERTPTPLPDFFVPSDALEDLKRDMRDRTRGLNVEQLEQLRATCLGSVWRHRTEWDRTSLIRELKDTVQEFVEEVSFDDMEGSSPM